MGQLQRSHTAELAINLREYSLFPLVESANRFLIVKALVDASPGTVKIRKDSLADLAWTWTWTDYEDETVFRWSQMAAVAPLESKAEKWESGSVTSSNSSHFDFSSNADEVFSHITGLPDTVSAAEFITL